MEVCGGGGLIQNIGQPVILPFYSSMGNTLVLWKECTFLPSPHVRLHGLQSLQGPQLSLKLAPEANNVLLQ